MQHGICCAIVGNFPAYLAGIFGSFDRVDLAIAVTRNPGLYILQIGNPVLYILRYRLSFNFGKFRFLLKTAAGNYFTYRVLLDDLSFLLESILFLLWGWTPFKFKFSTLFLG